MEKNLKSYTKQEVEKATLQYFKGDELATDVWIKKYSLKDNDKYYELTPDDMHHRIAKELARIEVKYPNSLNEGEIFETLKDFKRIIPQGSPMSGIGNDFQVVSLSNCFVIGNESDSYGGIMKLDQEVAQLEKRRGGVGLDLSFIRPLGSPVKNSAITSTGIVPFMERFSNTTKEIAQDGRRGALLLSLSIKHPDSEAFIDAKLTQGKVTGANISIKIDDDFMNSALNGIEYTQKFPVDSEIPKYTKKIDASKLWKKIVHNAWKSAEPGILYWSTIMKESIPDCYADLGFKTISVNPCQPLWAKVLTPNGIRELKDVNINDFIWSSEGWTKIINKKSNGIKKVYRYGTTFNCFYGTENHKVLNNNEKIEVKDSENIDLLRGVANKYKILPRIVMDGLVLGDGTVHKASNDLVLLCIGNKDGDYFNSEISDLIYNKRDGIGKYAHEIRTSITSEELVRTFNRKVPERYLNGDISTVCSFLRGIYTANGSVCGNRITLKSASFNIIEDVQLMLNSIGIASYYTVNKTKKIKFHNGEYDCKQNYDLNITRDIDKFKTYVGFIQTYKNEKLELILKNKNSSMTEIIPKKIKNIKLISEEEVIDITVDNDSHTYWTQGCDVSNCGEITLCESDSCRLVAINLFGYVINPFTTDSYFDFKLFANDVILAMRYIDDIVDLEIEKIDKILEKIISDPEDEFIKLYEKNLWTKIREKAIQGRRTGLSITGEGDMLAALNYTYGTDEATTFAVSVHRTLKLNAYSSSVQMAKERGAFPIYDAKREINNPFILRIKEQNPELYEDMVKHGRRNIALLTISPTGSASILTKTSSGIEPVFLPYYIRRRKINSQEKNVRIDFVDPEGVSWQEYPIFHHNFKLWLEVSGYDVNVIKSMTKLQIDEFVKKSPYNKATSNDVNWVKKIEMQGRVQLEVDHSISSTTNLPNDATEEMVSKVYEMGWLSGCKGLTVYRDGSRDGVLLASTEKKEDGFHEVHAPKRPKRLKAEIHRFQNNLEKWIAVVGMKDGRPYELFTGLLENGLSKLPSNVKECEVVKIIVETDELNEKGEKIKIKRYDIEYIDADGMKQAHTGLNHAFNPEYWNYAKLISGILRHGMPLISAYELIESLNFREESINTWKNGVARVIKRYVKDGEKSKGYCPECGSTDFVFAEGCIRCVKCSWSKC